MRGDVDDKSHDDDDECLVSPYWLLKIEVHVKLRFGSVKKVRSHKNHAMWMCHSCKAPFILIGLYPAQDGLMAGCAGSECTLMQGFETVEMLQNAPLYALSLSAKHMT